jgi:hypothetical protein
MTLPTEHVQTKRYRTQDIASINPGTLFVETLRQGLDSCGAVDTIQGGLLHDER